MNVDEHPTSDIGDPASPGGGIREGLRFFWSNKLLIGLVFGALITSRYTSKFGVGRLMAAGLLVTAVGAIIAPTIGGPMFVIVSAVILAQIAIDGGIVMYNVQMVSLRQAITPDRFQGRVTSILVVLSLVSVPIGGLLGGVLGETIGLRNTLIVGAIGAGAATSWLVYFGVWRVHALPAVNSE